MTDQSVMASERVVESQKVEDGTTPIRRYRRASSSAGTVQTESSFLAKINRLVIFALLLVFPLWFGGVHPFVHLTVYFVVTVVALVLLSQESKARRLIFDTNEFPVSAVVLRALLIFFGLVSANVIWHLLVPNPHPLFGEARQLAAVSPALNGLISIIFFCAVFVLVRTQIAAFSTSPFWFVKVIKYLVLVVGLTALSHWFYDNGKLFWTFEAVHTFISNRARWPFVNSNHLGIFLLQPFFLILAALAFDTLEIANGRFIPKTSRQRRSRAVQALLDSRLQKLIFELFFSFVLAIIAVMCVIGSLSRGTWLGISVGSLVYLLLGRCIRKSNTVENSRRGGILGIFLSSKRGDRAVQCRRQRGVRHSDDFQFDQMVALIASLARPILFLLALGAVLFFLYGRGLDLFDSRVEFGLLHSKDDMRWQLFADTLAILKNHFFGGIGIGNWAEIYPQYMYYQLAGINPVFLHSDPYQLLVEVGLICIVPIIFLGLFLTARVIRASRSLDAKYAYLLVAVYCGMLSVVVSAMLDFPFRVPAQLVLFGTNLALLAAILDSKSVGGERS